MGCTTDEPTEFEPPRLPPAAYDRWDCINNNDGTTFGYSEETLFDVIKYNNYHRFSLVDYDGVTRTLTVDEAGYIACTRE